MFGGNKKSYTLKQTCVYGLLLRPGIEWLSYLFFLYIWYFFKVFVFVMVKYLLINL